MTERLVTHVGQKLWYVPQGGTRGFEIEITKFGRVWGAFGFGRADVVTGEVERNGYVGIGQLYRSEQAWRDLEALGQLWLTFEEGVRWKTLEGLSESDIRSAASLLGIELPREGEKP